MCRTEDRAAGPAMPRGNRAVTHRADDADGDGVIQAEQRADRKQPFARTEVDRVAQLDDRQAG